MKKLFFQTATSSIMLLMILLVSFQMKAQTNYYSSQSNTLFGTNDSRLTATIKQDGNQVTMTVGAVGRVVADVFEFNVLFNPDSLQVTDSLFNPIAARGPASANPIIYSAIRINPAVKALQFEASPSMAIRKNGAAWQNGTGHSIMHAIDAQIHNLELTGPTRIEINSADFTPLFTVFFKKTNTELLDPNLIGFNISSSLGLVRSIRWVYEGSSISYDRALSGDERINPNLFSFRSPSSVQTKAVTGVAENLATFNGTFKRGELPPAFNLLDSVASTPRNTGKLLNDSIVRYGFFYTESNINITFTEYSDSITINGKNYLFPTNTMFTQGYFAAGQDTIKIVETGTKSSIRTQDYSDTVKGLKPNTTYNMWAFAQYVFETSKPYPLIGVKQTFSTSQTLNIASVFTAKDPTCGKNDGEIQIYVTGGSGSFEYSLDGKKYNKYPNGVIDNLVAGSYRIYVRDAYDTLYPAAVSAEIILRNTASDLFVNTAVTNASNCTLENGILHISAGGGTMPYTYLLNGESKNVANGQIAGLGAGVYVLNVTDALGCTVSSGEVHLGTNNPQFKLAVGKITHAQCNEGTGSVEFTVTGADYYHYQLDGMSVLTATSNAPILLNGLNAGTHNLRVFDTCGGEFSETIFIHNNDINGFAVKYTAENMKVACNGNVTKGSVTLTASNGTPTFKYTTNGATWTYFPTNSNTATINDLSEGTYYIQIVDTNGAECTYEINSIVIGRETASPLNILASYAVTEPTCSGKNGEIQIYATGGSGTYKYSVNNAAFQTYSNGLINNLGAGTYTIRIQDANDANCAIAQSESIVLHSINNDLNLSITAVDASTCGITGDGELYVTTSGGNGTYTYTWGNGTTAPVVNGKIDNLAAGVYVLNVTDGTCTISSGEIRIQSTTSSLTVEVIDSTNTICGSNVGTATFKVTGSSNYSYQVDGMPIVLATHNNPIVLNNLNAGVHNLRVFDNCKEINRQIIITNGKTGGFAFAIDVENVKVACDNSVIDGKIFVTATHGVQDYVCYIDSVKQNFAAGKDTLTLFVSEGIHYVRVEDNAGCYYEWNSIAVGRENIPSVNVGTIFASTDPTCNTYGEIQFYVNGGSGQYQYKYSKNGGSLSSLFNYTDGLISNLTAGNYKISVWDVNYPTCTPALSPDIVLTNNNSNFSVNVTADSASDCIASNGTLYVTVSGGSGNYDYKLNGISESPINNQYTKPAGAYVVEVIDNGNSGCVASSDEVRIYSQASTLAVTINNTTNTTCSISTGSVKFTVSGSSNYSYQLDGMPAVHATTNNPIVLNDLAAGVHTLRVFDNCGETSKPFIISNGINDLAFTSEIENVGCNTDPADRRIILTVTDGTAPYSYSIDNGKTWSTPEYSNPVIISKLLSGTYDVILKDAQGCQYEQTQIHIDEKGTIIPPTVMTPQTFCSGATVENLQAAGSGIKWYASPNSGIALNPSQSLVSGNIYYAVQTVGTCESQIRSAVKVIINDNITLDAPSLVSDQSFCPPSSGTLTLADIASNGNTNIVWYDRAVGGSELPINTPLANNTSYYAAQSAGNCQSAVRAEVMITIGNSNPDNANVASPQTFCKGALISDIAVPHNQVVWYSESINGVLLTAETVLQNGKTYYASYKAGGCESVSRTPVLISLTSPVAPTAPAVQTICGGGKTTLADLTVTGSGIVWYADEFGSTPLSPSALLRVDSIYYAAQSSSNCEGSRTAVRITDNCFTLKGTVFPFVHTSTKMDDLFPIFVKLYEYPTSMDCNNPLAAILNQVPIVTTQATYHDGSEWIPNTPKNPGTIGVFNNPGLPIDWLRIGQSAVNIDGRLLVKGESPQVTSPGASMGKYSLENIPPAKYLLVISRQGYVTRIGEITVTDNGFLGHRELVAGDVDDDFTVSSADGSAVKARFSSIEDPGYSPKYDMSGNGEINGEDLKYIKSNNSADFMIYEETLGWIFKMCK